MKKIISLILAMVCMLSFSSCAFLLILFNKADSDDPVVESIDTAPSINVDEYLPFVEDSKIVKYDSKTLKLIENLPIIDGATAAFPVYSAFVNAVYPNTTKLDDGVFVFNNTVGGYKSLAERKTDIFIGAAPSEKQVAYAEECDTVFDYTQIGWEAFVFFVHKDNPVTSLTADEIRKIYSGEITNWSQVGGNDEEIVPFQRDEGSGSQSMMLRFMDDVPLVEPDTEELVGFMGGIVDRVATYKNQTSSIGYSFRYYIEGIVCHPDIKMIAVDGVAPTAENIQNTTYPIIAPVYAVTYENNPNPNVKALIEWMLSDEGQYIIKESGYVGMK
ncbi:MAG: hypothetical protein E7673_05420 [Ruminococcaceae bacterium]|nr:hypothetical protein [Oscillospiraceae bacterium]